jgi:copper chaperone NosL
MRRRVVLAGTLGFTAAIGAACGSRAPAPADLDPAHDACASCRMIVSDRRFASQLVAPLEEPVFFDDLGCLAAYLKRTAVPIGAAVYVADHATGKWVPAGAAVYTEVAGATAPMGSHVIAHESAASRDADPLSAGGSAVTPAEVFPMGLPGGPR